MTVKLIVITAAQLWAFNNSELKPAFLASKQTVKEQRREKYEQYYLQKTN